MKKNRLLQIIELLEKGYYIKEIALELSLSAGYIQNILSNAYSIYGVRNSRGLLSIKSQILSQNHAINFRE
jgi:DNA-binding NarL/FixJ family response regulator